MKYSTSPRIGNPANGNHLEICLSSPQKNGNWLTWVLVALTVCLALETRLEPRLRLKPDEREL